MLLQHRKKKRGAAATLTFCWRNLRHCELSPLCRVRTCTRTSSQTAPRGQQARTTSTLPAAPMTSTCCQVRNKNDSDILTADQSDVGSGGIFARRTNRTREAGVYSHDGPIGRRKPGSLTTVGLCSGTHLSMDLQNYVCITKLRPIIIINPPL